MVGLIRSWCVLQWEVDNIDVCVDYEVKSLKTGSIRPWCCNARLTLSMWASMMR